MKWQDVLKDNKEKPIIEKIPNLSGDSKVKCPKCKGKGCSHCDDKGYHKKPSRGRGFTR